MMSDLKTNFYHELKRRFPVHFLAVFCLWPVVSYGIATVEALNIPYHSLSLKQAFLFSLGGVAVLLPDILVTGFLGLVASLTIFSILASYGYISHKKSRFSLLFEPMVLFVSLLLCASFFYPALFSHPVFSILRILPVWALAVILFSLATSSIALLSSPRKRITVVVIILLFSAAVPFSTISRNRLMPTVPAKPPVVLLGIDSVSLVDDLSHLEFWTKKNGGTWYTKAVSPGLLTNSVWTSILLMQPVREHGVFHTFQSRPEVTRRTLVQEAASRGFHTVSVFPDQLTCWVGSDYSFAADKSGPIGWKQLASSIFENATILLPLTKPLLPKLPFAVSPPNRAGTYTYSIDREFNEILSQSSRDKETLVIAHSTYLHVPTYPTSLELSGEELKRLLRSPADRVSDWSFDWQATDKPDDAIPVRQWKLNRVQRAFTAAMERMKFLERGGRIILLSDHGDRIGITRTNFWQKKYHNVMFATFNIPARPAHQPISLMDSGALLNLVESPPFAAEVEYTVSGPGEWGPLINSAKLDRDGRVSLDKGLMALIFSRLAYYRPYMDGRDW